MNAILPKLDMGIDQLGGEEISLDLLQIPDDLKQHLKEGVTNEISVKINDKGEKIIVSRQCGEISVKKLYTYHRDSEGKKTRFERCTQILQRIRYSPYPTGDTVQDE